MKRFAVITITLIFLFTVSAFTQGKAGASDQGESWGALAARHATEAKGFADKAKEIYKAIQGSKETSSSNLKSVKKNKESVESSGGQHREIRDEALYDTDRLAGWAKAKPQANALYTTAKDEYEKIKKADGQDIPQARRGADAAVLTCGDRDKQIIAIMSDAQSNLSQAVGSASSADVAAAEAAKYIQDKKPKHAQEAAGRARAARDNAERMRDSIEERAKSAQQNLADSNEAVLKSDESRKLAADALTRAKASMEIIKANFEKAKQMK
jgi:hypothetical protein